MKLVYCPECKKIKEREGGTDSILRNVTGLKGEPVYRGYCCVRTGGPEQFGKAFTSLSVPPGERPE